MTDARINALTYVDQADMDGLAALAVDRAGEAATEATTLKNLHHRAGVVNVRDYGATGDGVTDDTTAFENALADIPSKGGVLYAPAGRYIITRTLTIPASAMSIVGDGALSDLTFGANPESSTQLVWQGTVADTFAPGDVATAQDSILLPSHGLLDGDEITFSTTGTLPAPLVAGTTYYAKVLDANNISVRAGRGRYDDTSLVVITTQGTGTHTMRYGGRMFAYQATRVTVHNIAFAGSNEGDTYRAQCIFRYLANGNFGVGKAYFETCSFRHVEYGLLAGTTATSSNADETCFIRCETGFSRALLCTTSDQNMGWYFYAPRVYFSDSLHLCEAGGASYITDGFCVGVRTLIDVPDIGGVGSNNGFFVIRGLKVDGNQAYTPSIFISPRLAGTRVVHASDIHISNNITYDAQPLFGIYGQTRCVVDGLYNADLDELLFVVDGASGLTPSLHVNNMRVLNYTEAKWNLDASWITRDTWPSEIRFTDSYDGSTKILHTLSTHTTPQKVYDVTAFGADPTGVADSKAAIQAAIDAATSTGGTVEIPHGTYLLSASVFMKANVRLTGKGKLLAGGDITLVNCSSVSDWQIDGITIDGGTANTVAQKSVYVSLCQRFKVRNVKFTRGFGDSLHIRNSQQGEIIGNRFTSHKSIAAGSDINAVGQDIGVEQTNSLLTITGNHCLSAAGIGIALTTMTGTDTMRDIVVSNNTISGCRNYGIMGYTANVPTGGTILFQNITITGNSISNILGDLYNAVTPGQSTHGDGIYLQGVEYATITGNVIDNVCQFTTNTTQLTAGGISLNGGANGGINCTVANNIVRNSNVHGIDCVVAGTLKNWTISGNVVSNSTDIGIRVRHNLSAVGTQSLSFSGNTIATSGGIGVRIQKTGTANLHAVSMSGDSVMNSGSSGILVESTSRVSLSGVNVNVTGLQGISLSAVDVATLTGCCVKDQPNRGIDAGSTSKLFVNHCVLEVTTDLGGSNVPGIFPTDTYWSGSRVIGYTGEAEWRDSPLMLSGAATPVGSVTPYFIGQEYHETTTPAWYKSTGLANTNWLKLAPEPSTQVRRQINGWKFNLASQVIPAGGPGVTLFNSTTTSATPIRGDGTTCTLATTGHFNYDDVAGTYPEAHITLCLQVDEATALETVSLIFEKSLLGSSWVAADPGTLQIVAEATGNGKRWFTWSWVEDGYPYLRFRTGFPTTNAVTISQASFVIEQGY